MSAQIRSAVDALGACAKQAKELEQKAAKARTEADPAIKDRDGGIEQVQEVVAKERVLNELDQRITETRRELDIETD